MKTPEAGELDERILCQRTRAAIRLIGFDDRHVEERRVLRWLRSVRPAEVSGEDIRVRALGRCLDAES